MDWLPALLKHLGVSRSVVAAAFATSLVLYVGPRIAPNYVDPVPKDWSFALVAALAFSGTLLSLWLVASVWQAAERRWTRTTTLLASFRLNQTELDVLHILGQHPAEPLDLDSINYETSPLSRLELLELMLGLEEKGLVSVNPFSSNRLFTLTQRGRQRALEIQRASKSSA